MRIPFLLEEGEDVGHIDHSQLSLSNSWFLLVIITRFNTLLAFPYLFLVGFLVVHVLIRSMHCILSKLCVTLL